MVTINIDGLAPTVKGAISELIACQYLMCLGYEVFRNVCPTGSIDIVAIKGDTIKKFDVKTSRSRVCGEVLSQTRNKTDKQIKEGIEILHVSEKGDCFFESDVESRMIERDKQIIARQQARDMERAKPMPCRECGVSFTRGKVKSRRVYCSQICVDKARHKKVTRTTKTCCNCGKEFYGNIQNIFFSRACYREKPMQFIKTGNKTRNARPQGFIALKDKPQLSAHDIAKGNGYQPQPLDSD